ncbi:hypothetical protein DPMN_072524 [Dreissena polymorpha]|uniref:Uncharacterized protein n=1 Tax=Dreissena polymorpha TaxID=45954 RepID=A0A9D3Z9D9_DREPO|nr:hypothetical protein DPMN_072524 [Dreissena polymorpha]
MQHLAVPKVHGPPHNHNDVSPEGDQAEDPDTGAQNVIGHKVRARGELIRFR